MIHFFNYTDKASQELLDAVNWYEEKQKGLGLELLEYIDQAILSIDIVPLAFQKRLTIKTVELRFAPVQKFPYSIVYSINMLKNEIIIFAIWAHKKDPRKLKKGRK